MRILKSSLIAISFAAVPFLAQAHEIKDEKKAPDLSELKLPSKAEIQDMMDELPDLNKMMDGMVALSQDEDLINSLEATGEKLANRFEKMGELEMRDNGLPDLNLMMEEMMMVFADDDVMGEMLGVVQELTESIEENFDKKLIE